MKANTADKLLALLLGFDEKAPKRYLHYGCSSLNTLASLPINFQNGFRAPSCARL
jgi:hypothetical protein